MDRNKTTIKRIFCDIETSPNIVLAFRAGYDININHDAILLERKIICIGYKWEGERNSTVLRWDENQDDKEMLRKFLEIANEADEVVAHYGNHFDWLWLRTRCLFHKLPPIPVYKTVDTKALASKYFYFNSNKLDYISNFLGHGKKLKTEFDLWKKILIYRCEKSLNYMCKYCFTPDHKLLGRDLRWKPAGEFQEGETVLGFDENGPRRSYRAAKILRKITEISDIFEVTLESGKKFRVTGEHKWLAATPRGDGTKDAASFYWVETKHMVPDKTYIPKWLNVWDEEKSKEAGWLAGIFDGEGTVARRGQFVSIAQNPGIVYDRILRELSNRANIWTSRETISGKRCRTIAVRGGLIDCLTLLGTIRPERLISKIDFDNMGRVRSKLGIERVVSIEPCGKATIVKITTSTSTLVVDGYPMHNCGIDVKRLEAVYKDIAPYVPVRSHVGVLSGLAKWTCPRTGSQDVSKSKTKVTANGTVQHQMLSNAVGGGYYTISNSAYESYLEYRKKEHEKRLQKVRLSPSKRSR